MKSTQFFKMISLCQTDAAFGRVKHYNPDLDIELLFLGEAEAQEDDLAQIAQIRSALVVRVADIGMSNTNSRYESLVW